ncbi:hypothetical protein XA68_11147 [Ophiocordyceps unilateralis]|uniref:Uncharacterized protein n=1 Tax=Ophiocordyceps unilateralis TaxID=268505 RepID=A0A2A9PH04_OPHUN|nr:hypothetical protein XA68_11147 [Ophiocordyceps unilateralis]
MGPTAAAAAAAAAAPLGGSLGSAPASTVQSRSEAIRCLSGLGSRRRIARFAAAATHVVADSASSDMGQGAVMAGPWRMVRSRRLRGVELLLLLPLLLLVVVVVVVVVVAWLADVAVAVLSDAGEEEFVVMLYVMFGTTAEGAIATVNTTGVGWT